MPARLIVDSKLDGLDKPPEIPTSPGASKSGEPAGRSRFAASGLKSPPRTELRVRRIRDVQRITEGTVSAESGSKHIRPMECLRAQGILSRKQIPIVVPAVVFGDPLPASGHACDCTGRVWS